MEINLQFSMVQRSQSVADAVDSQLPLHDRLGLHLTASPPVDESIQNLTALQNQLQQLVGASDSTENPQSGVLGVDLSCNSVVMAASATPISLEAFLCELQREGVGRRACCPKLKLKINRIRRKCAICQEIVKEKHVVHRLHCKHIYHKHCLEEWRQRSQRCPLCRRHLS